MRKTRALVALLLCTIASAQNVTSSLTGVVVDPNQGGISTATTTLIDQPTGKRWTTTTFANGTFTYPNIPSGTYTLRIEATGFKGLEIPEIVVHANEVRTLRNVALKIGGVKESVSVTADDAVVAVQLGSGERSGLVSGSQLNELALKGRDFWAMLQILPGVVDDGSQSRETITWTDNRGTYINGGNKRPLPSILLAGSCVTPGTKRSIPAALLLTW